MSTRLTRYCPRCDGMTEWWNVARGGGNRYGCMVCGIEEAERMTEEEAARLAEHEGQLPRDQSVNL